MKVKSPLFFISTIFVLSLFFFFLKQGARGKEWLVSSISLMERGLKVDQRESPRDVSGYEVSYKEENRALKEELKHLKAFVTSEDRLERTLQRLEKVNLSHLKEEKQEWVERARKAVTRNVKSSQAKVIFWEGGSWGSHFWIDRGEKEVKKNSPVTFGDSLVGIIEHVGKRKSRVRLLLDPTFHPAVEVASSGERRVRLEEMIDSITAFLPQGEVEKEKQRLTHLLLKEKAQKRAFPLRGTLSGMGRSFYRGMSLPKLKGEGFYREGEGVEVGDLLITSGLDGVLPKGLHVATVTKVTREEGASMDTIEAIPTCSSFYRMTDVTVLSPL